MAELVQHLLTVGQVWGHELGGIHLDFLPYLPGRQARLGGRTERNPINQLPISGAIEALIAGTKCTKN